MNSIKINPPLLYWVIILITLISAVGSHDLATWFFELMIGGFGVAVLWMTRNKFRFSHFFMGVVLVHYVVLALGAHYTYALVPIPEWIDQAFGFERNHFDRVGHFMQGVTPALLAVEWLTRRSEMGSRWLISTAAVCVGLAFSALYEILEWGWVVIFYPGRGPEWLGMQGDPWDAQADMFMALCGGVVAVLLLGALHRRSMEKLDSPST